MPKIKWIGLIKEEKMKDYQVGELSKMLKNEYAYNFKRDDD